MQAKIHPQAKRLMLVRGLRSIGQGAMVVDLALYLRALNWSATAIGTILSAGGLFGAALILVVGVLSDRYGRKRFLLVYEALTVLCSVIAIWDTHTIFLALAIIIAGFGRGQSGAAGPFSPAEQAWMARLVPRSERGRVFSYNSAIGFLGMALGAVIGGSTQLWQNKFPGYLAFHPVFMLIALISLVCVLIIASISEAVDEASDDAYPTAPSAQIAPLDRTGNTRAESESEIWRKENWAMFKLGLINALNGLAIGMTGPMMAYWFAARYHVDAAAIGSTMAVAFLLTSVSSVLNGLLAARFGMVTAVTWVRIVGAILILFLPLSPNFAIAAVIYVARNALNRGTQGARSALGASLTRDKRRGFATSINAFSMRITSSIGPTIAGYLLDMNQFALPFYITAGLQFIYAGAYQKMFRSYERDESPVLEG
ncbi:MAG: MFS transporter [Peptococcaceae bacterium]|nr:MFS transporter [Peptococcaceae bacterium]